MKIQWLALLFLMLGACRTPAGTKENRDVSKAASSNVPEKLLQKIVGGITGEVRAQNFDCSVMSTDVADVAQVKKWIATIPKKTQRAYHFVAQSPSYQLYAFEGSEKIILIYDYDFIETPIETDQAANDALKALKSILEEKCPFSK